MGAALRSSAMSASSACRRRQQVPKTVTASKNRNEARLPSAEQIRDTWLLAVQEEDAAAAGWCARLCEGLRGAEGFADTDGLDAFLSVAMGQSVKTGSGGLMVALAQALMTDMTEFKVAIFETLAAAAHWPSLKGKVAGSGVLGVITATLLAPRHPPPVKALMVRLCGELAVDTPEAASLGDKRRAEEFAKLRGQLISSGALKAMVDMLTPESEAATASAAAGSIALLAGAGGDKTVRTELATAGAVPALLKRLSTESAEGTESGNPDDSDNEVHADFSLEAVASTLAKLAAVSDEGCEQLLEPLKDQSALVSLRDFLREGKVSFTDRRNAVEQVLLCLAQLGKKHGLWPELEPKLVEDLSRLLVFGSDAVLVLVEALAKSPAAEVPLSKLGDIRALRQALRQRKGSAASAAHKALEARPACDRCGCVSEQGLLKCGGCHKVAYCSKECQKADWKGHKASCQGGRK